MALIELPVIEDHERFRAELASVHPDGRRKWIYARKPKGKYTRARTIVSTFLLAFLAGAPFFKVGGHQFLLFNILSREFVFFGMTFWPSDFYLVALLFLTGVVSIVVFTATLGRIWCGWLCPQTVFMEMIFRKLEWLIEGTAGAQAKRNAGPWNFDRILRFSLKQTIFFSISFLIANVFLAYVISSDTLLRYVTHGPADHLALFIALVVFTFVFYFVFARFREQACLIVCPYGRYMSALIDENTVTVTYDTKRGEKRSKWRRGDTRSQADSGHCIDCHQCVTVCPTGIDIRNGIQLECVACTACIDACDDVMEKVGLPTGLIRYSSAKAIQAGQTTWLTARIKAYLGIWAVLVSVVIALFIFRSDLEVDVLRSPGTTWTKTSDGIANFYDIEVTNKTSTDLPLSLKLMEPEHAKLTPLGVPTHVAPGEMIKGRFLVTLLTGKSHERDEHEHEDAEYHGADKVDVSIDVMSDEKPIKHVTTKLLTP